MNLPPTPTTFERNFPANTGRSRPRQRSSQVLLALTLTAVTALVGTISGCGIGGEPTVAILGDSITSLGQPSLEDELGGDFDLTISGQFGYTVEEVLPAAKLVATKAREQVIINLGSNDVIGRLDIDASIATYKSMIELFESAECIHVVNINEHMVDLRSGEVLTDQAEQYNAELTALADADDRIDIIDWKTLTAETLSDAKPPVSTLTEDSIHPTDEGNTELNKLYRSALNDC